MKIAVYESGLWNDFEDIRNVINPPEFTVWIVSDDLTYEEIDALVEEHFNALDQAVAACFKAIGEAPCRPIRSAD